MSWPTPKAMSSACSRPAWTHSDAHRSHLDIRYLVDPVATEKRNVHRPPIEHLGGFGCAKSTTVELAASAAKCDNGAFGRDVLEHGNVVGLEFLLAQPQSELQALRSAILQVKQCAVNVEGNGPEQRVRGPVCRRILVPRKVRSR